MKADRFTKKFNYVLAFGCLLLALGGKQCPQLSECEGDDPSPTCTVPVPTPGVYDVKWLNEGGAQREEFFTSDGGPIHVPDCSAVVSQSSVDPSQVCNLVCPGDFTTISPSGVVNYPSPTTNNCAGLTIMCNPPSGSNFKGGTAKVNCEALNSSKVLVASCSFKVTAWDSCLQDDNNSAAYLFYNIHTFNTRGEISEAIDITFHCADGSTWGFGLHPIKNISGNTRHVEFSDSYSQFTLVADLDIVTGKGSATLTKKDGTKCVINDTIGPGTCGISH